MLSLNALSVTYRRSTLAGLLVAGLALPSAAHAQTIDGERALLNKNNTPFGLSKAEVTRVMDGERALLNRLVGDPTAFPPAATSVAPRPEGYRVDGQHALLNRQSFGHQRGRSSTGK
jgi:hypothetical protein